LPSVCLPLFPSSVAPPQRSCPPTALSSFALHDALPISSGRDRLFMNWHMLPLLRNLQGRMHWLFHCWQNWEEFSYWFPWLLSLRSEEHTSELQSRFDLVCSLLLEKKKEH